MITDLETFTSILTLFDVPFHQSISTDGRLVHIFSGLSHVTFWMVTGRLKLGRIRTKSDDTMLQL